MTAPTVYTSADGSAPTLTGQTASLNALLHACLVTGYGAKSAAGWTREFQAGDVSVYRPAAGLRHYLRVTDDAAQFSKITAFQSMTSVSAGTRQWPEPGTFSLYNTGIDTEVRFRKSVTANATARPWFLIANDEAFYLIGYGNRTVYGTYDGGDCHLGFGTLKDPARLPDDYRTFLVASENATDSTGIGAGPNVQPLVYMSGSSSNGRDGIWVMSDPTGLTRAEKCGRHAVGAPAFTTTSPISGSPGVGGTYPDPVNGNLNIARMVHLDRTGNRARGSFPGLWALPHSAGSFTHGDTFSGRAGSSLADRTFVIALTQGSGGVVFETTGGSW